MGEFYISDSHFNHRSIIDYCERPFFATEYMDEFMIKQWNSVVKKNDKVYHLGDFALGDKEYVTNIVSQLNGDIHLIKGNHDTRNNQWYRDCGIKEAYDHPIIVHEFMVLSHEPLPFVMNQCYVSVFGHIHNSPMFETWGKHHACVCVERHNYTPISFEAIKEHFVKGY